MKGAGFKTLERSLAENDALFTCIQLVKLL